MFDNLTDKQRKILIAIAIIVAIGVIYFIYRGENYNKTNVETEMLVQSSSQDTEKVESTTKDKIMIHIAGGVKNPGVVKLEEGSRIEDAINLAGGLTEDADITNVNLAYVLDDGVKVNIPRNSIEENSIDESQEIIQDGSGENVIDNNDLSNSIRTSKYK